MARAKSDPVFETLPRQITSLIHAMSEGRLQLPDFQRDFVWEARKTAELLRSVMSRYPAGNLLFWRLGVDHESFACRPIDGVSTSGETATELILDGQQRLTSLFQAMTGTGDEDFYLVLDEFVDQTEGRIKSVGEVAWDDAIVWADSGSKAGQEARAVGTQIERRWFPVYIEDYADWLDGMVEASHLDGEPANAMRKLYRGVYDNFVRYLDSYSFPVTTLPESTSIEAVCTVFETLNSTGKPLGPFELLTARFYPGGVNLRTLWEQARDDFTVLAEFDIDPYSLLQAVSLRTNKSAQRSDVLRNVRASDVRQEWPLVVDGMSRVIDQIRSQCGVLSKRYLPYSMLLVPMAAIVPDIVKMRSSDRSAAYAKLIQFYWASVFSLNYDQGANSQAGADYLALNSWILEDSEVAPEAITDFQLLWTTLRGATTRKKALYMGLLGLSVSTGARDFHSAQSLTPHRALQDSIESHHLFPKAYLAGKEWSSGSEIALNRALIDKVTNGVIGKKAPSTYLGEMREAHGESRLESVLDSHGIPLGALESNDYDSFLDQRAELFVERIESVTGCHITDDRLITE